jgi:hypothetical protein
MELTAVELAELEALEQERGQQVSDELSPLELQELADLEASKSDEEGSASQAALEGVSQGATLGFSDEIGASIQGIADDAQTIGNMLGIVDPSPTQVSQELIDRGFSGDLATDAYGLAVRENRNIIKDAKEKHPLAFTSGEVAGGLLLPGGGAAKAAAKAPKLIKTGVSLAGISSISALDSLGKSEEDQLEEQLSDALYGGAGGVAAFGLLGVAGKGAKLAGKALKEVGVDLSIKSMGIFNKSSKKKFFKMLENKRIAPKEFIERINNEVTVEGKALVTATKSQNDILADTSLRLDQLGDDMGHIIKEVESRTGEIKVSNKELAAYVTGKLAQKYQKDPTLTNQMKQAQSIIKRMDIKSELDDGSLSSVNYWKNDLLDDFQKNSERGFFGTSDIEQDTIKEISNFVELKISSASRDGDLINAYRDTKTRFGTLAEYGRFVDNSVKFDEEGMIGKVAKTLQGMPLAGAVAGGSSNAARTMAGFVLGSTLKTASKSPSLHRMASKAAMSVGVALEKGGKEAWVDRLGLAASRSFDDFMAEMDILNLKTQGFITDPGEAEQLEQQVRQSNLDVRSKMRASDQIKEGRVPDMQPVQKPFLKKYKARGRDENGRKVR